MDGNLVLAKVNDRQITQEDVMKFLRDIGPQVAAKFQTPEGMEKVVEELVSQELMLLDALDNNLSEDEDFNKLLEETKMELLKNYAISKLIANEKASEQELLDYYNKNKENFIKTESLRAGHILVENENKAHQIIHEIENGLLFKDAARKYSTCPSRSEGGSLGEFTKGQMVAEFEKAAFEMEEGKISKPIKTQFGYHIIQVEKRIPGGLKTFEETKNELQQNVVRLKQQEKYLNKIGELKTKYKVEIMGK